MNEALRVKDRFSYLNWKVSVVRAEPSLAERGKERWSLSSQEDAPLDLARKSVSPREKPTGVMKS